MQCAQVYNVAGRTSEGILWVSGTVLVLLVVGNMQVKYYRYVLTLIEVSLQGRPPWPRPFEVHHLMHAIGYHGEFQWVTGGNWCSAHLDEVLFNVLCHLWVASGRVTLTCKAPSDLLAPCRRHIPPCTELGKQVSIAHKQAM